MLWSRKYTKAFELGFQTALEYRANFLLMAVVLAVRPFGLFGRPEIIGSTHGVGISSRKPMPHRTLMAVSGIVFIGFGSPRSRIPLWAGTDCQLPASVTPLGTERWPAKR